MKLNFLLLHFHKMMLLTKLESSSTVSLTSCCPVVDTDGGMRQEGHLNGSAEWSNSKEMKITSLYSSTPPADWAQWGSLHSFIVTAVMCSCTHTFYRLCRMTQVSVCLMGKISRLTLGKQRQKNMSWAPTEVTLVPRRVVMLDESPGLWSQEFVGTGYTKRGSWEMANQGWPQRQDQTREFPSF